MEALTGVCIYKPRNAEGCQLFLEAQIEARKGLPLEPLKRACPADNLILDFKPLEL